MIRTAQLAPAHDSPAQTTKTMIDSCESEPNFGFFTVLEDPAGGMLGGLLVVNHRGRPLEFHCTAPVVPSRAEEILFGPTLQPHIHCERIGVALLARMAVKVSLLVVNQLDSWPIADETPVPVVLVAPRIASPVSIDCETAPPPSEACLDRLDPAVRGDAQALLEKLSRYVDLAEPFERIVEAIREAGLLGEQSADEPAPAEVAHDEAA